jgi:lycopene cyclase domain-containing protein
MAHVEYLSLLLAGVLSLLWVDQHYRTHVFRQWRRLAVVEAVVLVLFLSWDSLGVHRGYWRSRPERVAGLWPLSGVPVEEFVLLAMIGYATIVLWQLMHSRAGSGGRHESVERIQR